ncbi:hypothetical protein ACJJTC_011127, partial [Scirpophaga incertulas]
MSENDLQFQADLEKAQALSLESLALEQFRRQKLLTGTDNGRDAGVSSRRCDDSDGPPPALPPPPRKPPRGRNPAAETPRSTGGSPTRGESSDLISFASPTSKTAPQDVHTSLKEFIEQISKQTEELSVNTSEPATTTMNNQQNNQTAQGYSYPPAYYNYQYPYNAMSPYPPPAAYGVPSPMPMPNYSYYTPPIAASQEATPVYVPVNSPMYAPTLHYSQTRMASPSPYVPYTPPTPQTPQTPTYNYNTTNMIARPPRPVNLYPQLSQNHTYPTIPAKTPQKPNVINNNVLPPQLKNEPNRDNVNSQKPRKTSEVSIASNESNDTIGSLPKSLNLIDFGGRQAGSGPGSVRVSVLEAFDPLLTDQASAEYAVASECSSSVYEQYDPLDFLYGETEMRDTPVYATINKRESVMLPSPPPKTIPCVPAVAKRSTTNKLYDCIVKIRNRNYDNEHKAFLKMVLDIRRKFVYSDSKTNPGHVIAARSGGKYPPNTSIKILVHHIHSDEPITFTSDVESTVEHVILTVVCSLEEDIRDDMSGYMLRVWGAKEYLTPGSSLSEYDYVRECVRLEKDVRLCLHEGKDDSLARTERDDARHSHLTLDDLIPSQGATPTLSFDNLSILLETLEGELSRAVGVVGAEGTCSPKAVFQAVKAICALAGNLETLHLTHSLTAFANACNAQSNSNVKTPEIHGDNGPYSSVSLRSATARENVSMQCGRLRDAVRALLALYTRFRLLDFQLTDSQYLLHNTTNISQAVPAHTISEATLFCIEAVHCLPLCWNHDEYLFHAQVYYGTRPLKTLHLTQSAKIETAGFYPRIVFDTWINLEDVPICTLPREARLVLTLYGRTERTVDNQHPNENSQQSSNEQEDSDNVQYEQVELGWAAIQLFDFDGVLCSGTLALPLWPARCDRRIGPAPHPAHSPPPPHPVLNIEIPAYAHNGVKWTNGKDTKEKSLSQEDLPAFDSLDGHTQSQLLHLIEQGAYQRMPTEGREILWEKRQYLVEIPARYHLYCWPLPTGAGNIAHSSLLCWGCGSNRRLLNAMHLLLPCFPDEAVRKIAATLINKMSDDELCQVLPQLAQALQHETYECSPLAAAPAVAHKLFWLLVHSLPNVPQAPNQEFLGITLDENPDECQPGDACVTAEGRCRLLLRALLAVCGDNMHRTLLRQRLLVK